MLYSLNKNKLLLPYICFQDFPSKLLLSIPSFYLILGKIVVSETKKPQILWRNSIKVNFSLTQRTVWVTHVSQFLPSCDSPVPKDLLGVNHWNYYIQPACEERERAQRMIERMIYGLVLEGACIIILTLHWPELDTWLHLAANRRKMKQANTLST